jgi:predicted DNA-binding protein
MKKKAYSVRLSEEDLARVEIIKNRTKTLTLTDVVRKSIKKYYEEVGKVGFDGISVFSKK